MFLTHWSIILLLSCEDSQWVRALGIQTRGVGLDHSIHIQAQVWLCSPLTPELGIGGNRKITGAWRPDHVAKNWLTLGSVREPV